MKKQFDKLIDLANEFIDNNQPHIARKCFKDALALEPDNPIALEGLAWTYHMEGKNEKAKKILEKIIDNNENFAEAYTDLGCVLYSLGNVEQAEEMHKISIELEPTRLDAKYNLAYMYFEEKRLDDAEILLEENADILLKDSKLLQILGEIKILKNELHKAKKLFELCLEKDEHNVEAGILLAYVDFEIQ